MASQSDHGFSPSLPSSNNTPKSLIEKSNFPPVRACLFDLDGLLIDSEDAYHCIDNTILREHGRPDFPWRVKARLQGRPGPVAHRIFQEWAQLPLSKDEFAARVEELQKDALSQCKPLPGVEDLLRKLECQCRTVDDGKVHMAIATSSSRAKFDMKTRSMTRLFSRFPEQNIILGDDFRIKEGRGKPFPDIYLLALDTINSNLTEEEHAIIPEECLVFEDSVLGVESGRRAGMRVIWCPHPGLLGEYKGREEEVLAGKASDYSDNPGWNNSDGLESSAVLNDGWAEMILSLEDFDFENYGINVVEPK